MKLLLVEDELPLQASLVEMLRQQGMVVETAATVAEGVEKVGLYSYDIVLLDVGLPDGSGLDILRATKAALTNAGVLVLSAKNSLEDKLEGLDLGADDYLTKPFHFAELLARLKAIYRRRQLQGRLKLSHGDLHLFPEEKRAMVHDTVLGLTAKEFDLLLHFVTNAGRVMTKAEIAEHLWGDMADSYDNFDFIYAHVKNLRKKIMDLGGGDPVRTVYGVGYKFVTE